MSEDVVVADPEASAVVPAAEALDLGYTISTEAFSGPLDLLLFLVRRTEVDVFDIPLVTVIDQFVATIEAWKDMDLEVAGDFIAMAATLLEIKARLVAPPPEGEEVPEEDSDLFDPRADLISALLAYRRFKEAAQELETLEAAAAGRVRRQYREAIPDDPDDTPELELGDIDAHLLMRTCEIILARINGLGPRTVPIDDVPLTLRINALIELMRERRRTTMRELLAQEQATTSRLGVVLATLECTRQRFVELKQLEQYGNVDLRWRDDEERNQTPVLPPEDAPPIGRRRRRPPLVTWTPPPRAAEAPEEDEASGPEESQETDEQRFLHELDQLCDLSNVLERTQDVEKSFLSHWYELHPEQRPPEPPAPEPVPPTPEPPPAPANAAPPTPRKPRVRPVQTSETAEVPAVSEPASVPDAPTTELSVVIPAPLEDTRPAEPTVEASGIVIAETPVSPVIPADEVPLIAPPVPQAIVETTPISISDPPVTPPEIPAVIPEETPPPVILVAAPIPEPEQVLPAPLAKLSDELSPVPPEILPDVPVAEPEPVPQPSISEMPQADALSPAVPVPDIVEASIPAEVTASPIPPALEVTPPSQDISPARDQEAEEEEEAVQDESEDEDDVEDEEEEEEEEIEDSRRAPLADPDEVNAALLAAEEPPLLRFIEQAEDIQPAGMKGADYLAQVEKEPRAAVVPPVLATPTVMVTEREPEAVSQGDEVPAAGETPEIPGAEIVPEIATNFDEIQTAGETPEIPVAEIVPGIAADFDEVQTAGETPAIPETPGIPETLEIVQDTVLLTATVPETAVSINSCQAPEQVLLEDDSCPTLAILPPLAEDDILVSSAYQEEVHADPWPIPNVENVIIPHDDFSACNPHDESREEVPPIVPETPQRMTEPLVVLITTTNDPLAEALPLIAAPLPPTRPATSEPEIVAPFVPPPAAELPPDPEPSPPSVAPPEEPPPLDPEPSIAHEKPATDLEAEEEMKAARKLRIWRLIAILIALTLGLGLLLVWWTWVPRNVLEVNGGIENGSEIDGRTPLTWSFNLDVLPEAQPAPRLPLPVIIPAAAGAWTWSDRRTLVFTPQGTLPPATNFSFSLAKDSLRSAGGFRLVNGLSTTVHTPPLAVLGCSVVSFAADGSSTVVLSFNHEVDPVAVATAAQAEQAGTTLKIEAMDRAATSAPRLRIIGTGPVMLGLPAGLTGSVGSLGLTTAWNNPLVLGPTLHATAITAALDGRGKGTLRIAADGVELSLLATVISLEPALPFQPTVRDGAVEISGSFMPLTEYRVQIAACWPEEHPAHALAAYPAAASFTVTMPHRQPSLWLSTDRRPNAHLAIEAVNTGRLTATVLSADGDVALASTVITDDSKPDQPWQTTVDTQALLSGLAPGYYRVRISDGTTSALALVDKLVVPPAHMLAAWMEWQTAHRMPLPAGETGLRICLVSKVP